MLAWEYRSLRSQNQHLWFLWSTYQWKVTSLIMCRCCFGLADCLWGKVKKTMRLMKLLSCEYCFINICHTSSIEKMYSWTVFKWFSDSWSMCKEDEQTCKCRVFLGSITANMVHLFPLKTPSYMHFFSRMNLKHWHKCMLFYRKFMVVIYKAALSDFAKIE